MVTDRSSIPSLWFLTPRGFSLVEVLASLVLVSVGLLGTVLLAGTVMRGNVQSKHTDAALFAAQQKLEALRAQGYDATVVGAGVSPAIDGIFDRTTVVRAGPQPHTKTVDVYVAWRDPGRHQVALTGMLYDADFGTSDLPSQPSPSEPSSPSQPSPSQPSPSEPSSPSQPSPSQPSPSEPSSPSQPSPSQPSPSEPSSPSQPSPSQPSPPSPSPPEGDGG